MSKLSSFHIKETERLIHSVSKDTFSKMLIYLVALSLISFCSSVPGESFHWYQASLFQRSPVTAFFAEQQRDVNTTDPEFVTYVNKHWKKYHKEWIINRFWAFNEAGQHIDDCTFDEERREKAYYNGRLVKSEHKKLLKKYWPSVKPDLSDRTVWALEFNTTGSCVASMDFYYFNLVLQLVTERNVGTILAKNNIHPGGDYEYNRIVNALSNTLQKEFTIKCLTPQNTEKQYLLEVEQCINLDHELVDCVQKPETSHLYACDPNKDVFYPALPRNQL